MCYSYSVNLIRHLGCVKAEIIPIEPDAVRTDEGKCVSNKKLFFVVQKSILDSSFVVSKGLFRSF